MAIIMNRPSIDDQLALVAEAGLASSGRGTRLMRPLRSNTQKKKRIESDVVAFDGAKMTVVGPDPTQASSGLAPKAQRTATNIPLAWRLNIDSDGVARSEYRSNDAISRTPGLTQTNAAGVPIGMRMVDVPVTQGRAAVGVPDRPRVVAGASPRRMAEQGLAPLVNFNDPKLSAQMVGLGPRPQGVNRNGVPVTGIVYQQMMHERAMRDLYRMQNPGVSGEDAEAAGRVMSRVGADPDRLHAANEGIERAQLEKTKVAGEIGVAVLGEMGRRKEVEAQARAGDQDRQLKREVAGAEMLSARERDKRAAKEAAAERRFKSEVIVNELASERIKEQRAAEEAAAERRLKREGMQGEAAQERRRQDIAATQALTGLAPESQPAAADAMGLGGLAGEIAARPAAMERPQWLTPELELTLKLANQVDASDPKAYEKRISQIAKDRKIRAEDLKAMMREYAQYQQGGRAAAAGGRPGDDTDGYRNYAANRRAATQR
jgi:hypothetical protein